jgi:phosphoribosyl-AMP cyclohydrolase
MPQSRRQPSSNLVIAGGTEYHLEVFCHSFAVVEIRELQPNFEKLNGMVPAIAQDAETGEVLMLAWMNRDAFEETLRTRRACYYSRSRDRLWRKGEESGHVQDVEAIYVDCDADTILLKVRQHGGAACHEGYKSCFFRELDGDQARIVGERVFDPSTVYAKS